MTEFSLIRYLVPQSIALSHFLGHNTGCFLTGPPLKMSLDCPLPHKSLDWPPSKSSKYENHQALRLFSIIRGGQSGTLTFFRNLLLIGQHLANSGEAQLKKHPVSGQGEQIPKGNMTNINIFQKHIKSSPNKIPRF